MEFLAALLTTLTRMTVTTALPRRLACCLTGSCKSGGSGSSSTTTTSTSSSSSKKAAEKPDESPRQRVRVPACVRRPGQAEVVPYFAPSYGNLRYNTTSNFIRAHCWMHGAACKEQRAAYTNLQRPGQGRPVGLLMHWLLTARDYPTAKAHIDAMPGNYQERLAAQRHFCAASSECQEFENQ